MKMHPLAFAVVVLLTVGAIGAQANQKLEPVRVFVFTAEPAGGFVDEDLKERRATMSDLLDSLAGKKAIKLVFEREQADLIAEVVSRTVEDTGRESTTTNRGLFGTSSSRTRKETKYVVRVLLSLGTYTTEILGENRGPSKRTAANRASNQIDDWVKDNHARVMAARTTP